MNYQNLSVNLLDYNMRNKNKRTRCPSGNERPTPEGSGKQKRWTRCLVRGFYELEPEYYYQQASVPTIAAIVLATNHLLLDKIVSYLNSKDTLNLIRAIGTEQVYLERLLKLRQNQSKISPWSRDGLSDNWREDRYEKDIIYSLFCFSKYDLKSVISLKDLNRDTVRTCFDTLWGFIVSRQCPWSFYPIAELVSEKFLIQYADLINVEKLKQLKTFERNFSPLFDKTFPNYKTLEIICSECFGALQSGRCLNCEEKTCVRCDYRSHTKITYEPSGWGDYACESCAGCRQYTCFSD